MSGKDDKETFAGFDAEPPGESNDTLADGVLPDEQGTWHDPDAPLPESQKPASPTDEDEEGTGEKIGQYRIIGVLGEGGMGVVYKARQSKPRRLVAIKVIHGHMASPAMRSRFAFEAEVLARLDHVGIAKIYEAVQDGSRSWFAMEFVDGAPLDDWAQINDLDINGRLELVARVCDAVHHAHMRGVVHRDLKPGNVIVDGSGQPKILDFGIARAVSDDMDPGVKHTRAGQLVGTPAYMSPEQATLGGEDLDARSDVYSTGVILWELLTGKLPHDLAGKSLTEMVRVIREVDAPLLSRVRQNIPEDVTSIVGKSLQKDAQDRYQSAAALAEDIRRYLNDEPVSARRATAMQQLMRLARRNKLVSSLVAALIVCTGVGLGVVSGLYVGMLEAFEEAEQQKQAAQDANTHLEERNADLTVMRAHSLLESDPTAAVAWLKTLDASAAWDDAFSVAHQARGLGVATDVLVGHTDEVRRVEFSPDGRFVVTASYDDTARIWDLQQHRWAELDEHAGDVRFARYSPDGSTLVTADRDGGVFLHLGLGLEFVGSRKLESHQGTIEAMAWSPDGAHFATASEDGSAHVWSHRGHLVRKLDPLVPLGHLTWLPDGERVVTAGDGGHLAIWTLDDAPATYLEGVSGEVLWAEASPDGTQLLTGDDEGALRLWNLDDGSHEVLWDGDSEMRTVRWLPDGHSALAIDRDGGLHQIAVGTSGLRHHVFRGHTGVIRTLALSPDGTTAATGGDDTDVWLWDLASGAGRRLLGHTGRVRLLDFSPDGSQLVSASGDGSARIWPVHGAPATLVGHENTVFAGAFVPGTDGQQVTTVSEDETVRTWDVHNGASSVFTGHSDEVDDVVWSRDGQVRATAGRDNRIWVTEAGAEPTELAWTDTIDRVDVYGTRVAGAARTSAIPLWNLADGSRAELAGHDDRVGDIAFSPDGSTLMSGGYDGRLLRWDVNNGTSDEVRRFGDAVIDIAWSPDGRHYAVASEDGQATLFGADHVPTASHQIDGALRDVAWSPDGLWAAFAGSDGAVQLLRVATGQHQTLVGHEHEVMAVGWLGPRRLVSGDAGGQLLLWELDGGEPLRLTGAEAAIRFITPSPDQRFFVAGGDDPTVHVWPSEVPRGAAAVGGLLDELTRVELAGDGGLLSVWERAE